MNENKNQRLGLGIFENSEGSLFVQPRAPQDKEPSRIRRLVLSFTLGLGLLTALMALFQQPFLFEGPHSVAAATLCVNTTGTGGCYTKIQDAIDAASQGDVITVAAGTYNEHITMTNGVSIHGQGWPSTIIDGGYSMPRATVYIPPGVSASTVLSGVQITGGGTGATTTSVSAYVQGGGIQIEHASPSIVNTWVYSCTAKEGGGVFVNGGSPSFDNVPVWNSQAERGGGFYLQNGAEVTITSDFVGTNGTVLDNFALLDGGGIYMTGVTATLSGLRFNHNIATYGGGVCIWNTPNRVRLLLNDISFNYSAPPIGGGEGGGGIRADSATNLEIVGNVINLNTDDGGGGGAAFGQSAGLVQWNWFINNTSGGSGGGVTVYGTSTTGLKLQGNWFEGNTAGAGGGLNLDTGAAPLVDANTFVTNTASSGSGIYLYQAGTAKMTNNIVARNIGTGGGVVIIESPGQLINNTIADNTGDGVFFVKAEGVTIVNNIISGNSDDGIVRFTLEPTASYTADYNDLYNNTGVDYGGLSAGAHDMSVDPQFVGTGPNLTAYYHITNTSPVSATGSLSSAPQRDIDGDSRISDGSVSMGADEFAGDAEYPVYLPLILRSS